MNSRTIYDADTIADYVIWYAKQKNDYSVNNIKLQKVLYFLQAEFLIETDHELFYDDIEAWDFGPVVPSVYYRFRIQGTCHILMHDEDLEIAPKLIRKEDRKIIDPVLDMLQPYSAYQLSDITVNQAVWKKYHNDRYRVYRTDKIKYAVIPTWAIKNYYENEQVR